MGNVAFSGLGITSINGPIGNQTITRNAYGPYAKSRGTGPAITTTPLQDWRDNYEDIHANWFLLTDAEREAWQLQAVSDTRVQRLKRSIGNVERTRQLTGFHYFMQVNLNLSLIAVAPLVTPAPVEQLGRVFNFEGTYDIAFDAMNFAFDYDFPNTYKTVVYSTFGMSYGRMSANQKYSSWLAPFSTQTGTGTDTASIAGTWSARFGSSFSPPYKIFLKLVAINPRTGQRCVEAYARVIAS